MRLDKTLWEKKKRNGRDGENEMFARVVNELHLMLLWSPNNELHSIRRLRDDGISV